MDDSNQLCQNSLRSSVRGFTLVELLVAMGILMVIVMMMANLFKQSSLAWESGLRQSELGLEARAVIGMIQRELSQAVADSNRLFTAEGSLLDFHMLGDAVEGARQVVSVRYQYQQSGSRLNRTTPDGVHGLLDNVQAFHVSTRGGSVSGTNAVPDWVDIRLDLSKRSSLSEVRVWSVGRDGESGTDDDRLLRTWRGE